MAEEPELCGACRRPQVWTPPVSVILLFAPGLQKPYPLIPAEEYRVHADKDCDSIFQLVWRAAESHPQTREGRVGPWTRALVVFADGHGIDVKAKRMETARA